VNGGEGFVFDSTRNDAGGGTLTNCIGSWNGGDGLRFKRSGFNTIVGGA
jgi:hypothetical protein